MSRFSRLVISSSHTTTPSSFTCPTCTHTRKRECRTFTRLSSHLGTHDLWSITKSMLSCATEVVTDHTILHLNLCTYVHEGMSHFTLPGSRLHTHPSPVLALNLCTYVQKSTYLFTILGNLSYGQSPPSHSPNLCTRVQRRSLRFTHLERHLHA